MFLLETNIYDNIYQSVHCIACIYAHTKGQKLGRVWSQKGHVCQKIEIYGVFKWGKRGLITWRVVVQCY